jgi:hypothetical protein
VYESAPKSGVGLAMVDSYLHTDRFISICYEPDSWQNEFLPI